MEIVASYKGETEIQLAQTPTPAIMMSQRLVAELHSQTKAGVLEALRSPLPRLPYLQTPGRGTPLTGMTHLPSCRNKHVWKLFKKS